MRKIAVAAVAVLFVLLAVTTVGSQTTVQVRIYTDFEGDRVYICKDQDGFLAWFRDYEGSWSYGTGYTWDDVREDFRIETSLFTLQNWSSYTDCSDVYDATY